MLDKAKCIEIDPLSKDSAFNDAPRFQDDTSPMMTVRNKFFKGVLASLRNSVITLLCRTDLTVGTEATKLVNLKVI